MFGRRLGIATTTLSAAFALALGLSGPANAAVIGYQNVYVQFSGGDAQAMNDCIADAQDGVIQTQIQSCDQLSNGGNLVSLDGVNVWIHYPKSAKVYSYTDVTLSIDGGWASAMNACILDAYDGVVQTQIQSCKQVATAGNLISISGVNAVVTTP
jgi:hypothetical protein